MNTTSVESSHTAVTDRAMGIMARGIWLLPVFGLLLLWSTWEQQPDPRTEFTAWSEFVTTDTFFIQHVVGSIGGQALHALGAAALGGVHLLSSRRTRQAVLGTVLSLVGDAGLLAGFGVAAFAQPPVGRLQLSEYAGAHDVYDQMYSPSAISVLAGGLLLSIGSVLLARAAATIAAVPRWATLTYGASGPLVGLGLFVGAGLQPLGAILGVIGGVGLALRLRRERS